MLVLSLLLNVAVLVTVCAGLLSGADWTRECYGEDTAGRRILLSVYVAIGLVSGWLLFARRPDAAATLLLVQVVYKLTTPFTVGTLANPVVVSNLGIAAIHASTLVAIRRGGGLQSPAGR